MVARLNPEGNFPFMMCILKVNTQSSGWAKMVMQVLKSVHGVNSFRMGADGTVEVSGTVNPNLLLKMLDKEGKNAKICWFQFGECSSNLYMPVLPPQIPNNGYGYGDKKHFKYNTSGLNMLTGAPQMPNDYNNYQNCPNDGYGYGVDKYLQCNIAGPERSLSCIYSPCHSLHASPTSNSHASHGKKSLRTSSKDIQCCSLM